METKTVTLAEAMNALSVLQKRMTDDVHFLKTHCCRASTLVDPLEGEGGGKKLVTARIQSFYDKLDRFMAIRKAINEKNMTVQVKIDGTLDEDGVEFHDAKSLKDWLDWDRHGRPLEELLWETVKRHQEGALADVSSFGTVGKDEAEKKVIFNVPLTRAPEELNALFAKHSKLDARKSVANATETVTV